MIKTSSLLTLSALQNTTSKLICVKEGRAKSRKVGESRGVYRFREAQAAYNSDFTPEKDVLRAQNSYLRLSFAFDGKEMNVTISQLSIVSYGDILSLWQQCEGVGLSDADSRENIQSYLDRNPGMSFIATSDGRVIGTVLGGHDGRRGYIHHLAVHPDCRRQGIGRQLAERCLQVLGDEGIQKCHIFIFNNNAGGIAFWKSMGWTHRKDISVISKTI